MIIQKILENFLNLLYITLYQKIVKRYKFPYPYVNADDK